MTTMMLAGKIAVITGGGSGIGKAIALAFSREQAFSIVLDQNIAAAEAVAEEIRQTGAQAFAIQADVASSTQVSSAFEEIRKHTEKLDILVNAAGMYVYKNAMTLEECEWERCLGVDLKGAWLCCKDSLPMLIKAGRGSIINIASTHADRAQSQAFPYGVAKGGLLSLTRSLAVDFGGNGIRVNAISPGLVLSPLTLDYFAQRPHISIDELIALQPLPVRILPEDVADAALFLVSNMARCVTGTTLYVDGGRTIFSGIHHTD
jgi:NAD(P)-dependent dehydrogenase (short-subunit alcohol dehydrogenase family)